MDRRQGWRVGGKSFSPVTRQIIDTVSNGVAYPAVIDPAGQWRLPSVVYLNTVVTTVTGLTEKKIAQFYLRANALGSDHRMHIRMVGQSYVVAAASAVIFTLRVKVGTATNVNDAFTYGPALAVSGQGEALQLGIVASTSTVWKAERGVRIVGSNTNSPRMVGLTTQTFTGSASQLISISMQISKNVAGTFFRPRYVEVVWQ